MRRSILDKKRAQEMSISTIVILALAVIVLVVVVLGFSKGWNYIFSKIAFLPDDLTTAVTACETYAGSEALAVSFCQPKELRINGVKQYMNCNSVLDEAKKVIETPGYVTKSCVALDLAKFCSDNKLKEGKLVNGNPCPEIVVLKVAEEEVVEPVVPADITAPTTVD